MKSPCMKSPCVSVTGATGFLGHHIVEAFHRAGWTVRAIVRPDSPHPPPPHAEPRVAALGDVSALVDACSGSDVIVHAAGVVRAPRAGVFEAVNVGGTRATATAAALTGARLVHISSLAAIGPSTSGRPAREDDPPRPINAYGRSKMDGESAVRDHARGNWIVLRPSAVYGPGDRGFLPLVRLAARGVFPLVASRELPLTVVHARDVAEAVRLAAESDVRGEAFFIGHAVPARAEAFFEAVAAALGRPYRALPIPRFAVRLAGLAGDLQWRLGRTPMLDSARVAELVAPGFVCDVTRATERIGFTASTGLSEGLAQTVSWYRRAGWI